MAGVSVASQSQSAIITILSNSGSSRQISDCDTRISDRFLIDSDIIDSLEPGKIDKKDIEIGGKIFNQIVLLDSDMGFTSLDQSDPGTILALVDGSTGPVDLSSITIDSNRKLFVVGIPLEPDDYDDTTRNGPEIKSGFSVLPASTAATEFTLNREVISGQFPSGSGDQNSGNNSGSSGNGDHNEPPGKPVVQFSNSRRLTENSLPYCGGSKLV